MSEPQAVPYPEHKTHTVLLPIAAAVALLAAIAALIWAGLLQRQLTHTIADLTTARADEAILSRRLESADDRARTASRTLAEKLGTTEAQMDAKAEAIRTRQQQDAERLQSSQRAAEKRLSEDVSSVKNDVGTVRTDVGGIRTDLGSAKADLADTKSQLLRTIGDAGIMSGQIARTHEELEELRHHTDRTYYEFNLQKGGPPTLLSTIKVQLKKTDAKKGRYTLNVNADDRLIEKKDKTLDEPVQFYSGKTPALYELVVNNIGKNTVSGYLSVPKGQ